MTDSEQQQILKMIEDGKITAEEGLILMQALGEAPEDESLPEVLPGERLPSLVTEPGGEAEREPTADPEFDRRLSRFRRLWIIPLTIGVALTVSGAGWMYTALRAGGLGFWFYLAWLPFLLGVLVTAVGFASRTSRWIYVNVKQQPGASPQRIVIAFPLSAVSWLMTFVKGSVTEHQRGAIDEIMGAVFQSTKSSEPLLVEVEEETGEHVQVYIG